MLKIEVFQEDVSVNARNMPPKDGKPGRTIQIDSSSFVVNNFGGLELKRFGLRIMPMTPASKSTELKPVGTGRDSQI